MLKTLSPKKFVVISHIFASGPAQALIEYLNSNDKFEDVLFIGHPLFYQPQIKEGSFLTLYKKGKIEKYIFTKNIKFPSIISYIKDVYLSIWGVIKTRQKWDIIICADCLNTFSGLILRFLKKAKKVIFYSVDYVPKRFKNPLLNYIYHYLDKISVKFADQTWNLSPNMEIARKQLKGVETPPGKQVVVPMGIWHEKINKTSFNNINKNTLVFMGHLIEKQGVQIVIKSIPQIIKSIPDFKFLIIGTGDYLQNLIELTRNLKVEKYIEFTGYIENHNDMENLISRCSLAIAPYVEGNIDENFTYYADSGKIKDYLGAGVPVILTNVPYNAIDIESNRCGIIVKYDENEIAKSVSELMKDENRLKIYRKNAIKYSKQFDWNLIFDRALKLLGN